MSNRGSEWRKWDLHIHTPDSICQNYGNTPESWEKFICALENLPKEIKVIGINDYYFIDGFEKVINNKNQGRLKNIDKIFPILEFRIDTFGSGNENNLQKINLHIIFKIDDNNAKNEINAIKEEFIKKIPITRLEKHKTKSLSKENFIKESSNNSLQSGFSELIPPTDQVFDLLYSSTWKDKIFLLLGYKEWSNLDKNNQLKPLKEYLYSKVDAFFTSNVETLPKSQNWLNEFGNKCLLHSLDIHDYTFLDTYEFEDEDKKNKKLIENYFCNTWIKAHPTFEGLKQIIYEPEQRVKIQKEKPDFKEGKLVIDEVRFYSDEIEGTNEKLFTDEVIKLNKNLNVIIGGRSSGKSILLYNIAKTLLKDHTLLKEEEIEDKYNFRKRTSNREANISYNFEIKTLGGISQKMIKDEDENENSILPEIKYIPQNYLIKLAEPKINGKGEELYKIIRELIKENNDSKLFYDEFIDNVGVYDKKSLQLINDFFDWKEKIVKYDDELKSKGGKDVLEKNIQDNQVRIEELSKGIGLTDEKILEYQKLQEKLEKINKSISEINSDYKAIQTFNNSFLDQLKKLKGDRDQTLASLSNEEIKTEFTTKYNDLDTLVNTIEDYNSYMAIDVNEEGEKNWRNPEGIFSKLLRKKGEEKLKIEEKIKPFLDNEAVKKQIEELEESIKGDRESLQIIVKLEDNINIAEIKLQGLKEEIFNLYINNLDEYNKVIENLRNRTDDIEQKDNLKITGIIKYNYSNLISDLKGIIHNRHIIFSEHKILNEGNKKEEFKKETLLVEIKKLFDDILNIEKEDRRQDPFKGKSKKDAIIALLKDNFLDYWELEYEGDKLAQMSSGKASFVILMLIIGLSESNAPILIDQPEDNLDNRSITKDLVKFLKLKKLERQIILVTHNPNIVVNADAENVIVANQKGQGDFETDSPYQFDYINGALEDTKPKDENEKDLLKSMGIREHITEIVEGGKEAFQQREKKYGF